MVEALTRRVELRRQKWQLQRREAELEATKNFLLPRFDATGRYRWRGFGQDLMSNGGTGEFNNAYSDLVSGRFQEWQAGLDLSMPIGFRKAYSAVRQAELHVAREKAILHEAERSVVFDLSNAISDVDRAYAVVETNLNRRIAAAEQLAAIETDEEFGTDTALLYVSLEAQRRLAEAETSYFRSLVEYQLAIKNVQLEKGTLLAYNEIHLNEGVWPAKAHDDANKREWLRGEQYPYDEPPHPLGIFKLTPPEASSEGIYPQSVPRQPVGPTSSFAEDGQPLYERTTPQQ
jgi:outer membrane protein TolC